MAKRNISMDLQEQLIDLRSTSQIFRDVYFHLYSNSRASRAESILGDLSLLLLCKITAETSKNSKRMDDFLCGNGTANGDLLPILGEIADGPLWKDEKFRLDDSSLRFALREIQTINFLSSSSHVLGEAFQALIGPGIRGDKGQFFTPRSLVDSMASILDVAPNETVLDPACGTGGFLASSQIIKKTGFCDGMPRVFGVDKDQGLARLAQALLSAMMPNGARIASFNSLDLTSWQGALGLNPEGYFDVVLTNPPFGAKIGVTEPRILAQYDLGSIWVEARNGTWLQSKSLALAQDPQVLFLELAVRCLKPGGRLGIVLPEGLFGNLQTAYVWDWLEQRGKIDALLDCPRTTFQPSTDVKTNVLFFTRSESPKHRHARIAVAVHCGHDKRGRSVLSCGNAHVDDFTRLAASFKTKRSTDWKEIDLKGLRYLVPRYFAEAPTADEGEAQVVSTASFMTLGQLVELGVISIRKGNEVGSEAYGTGEIPFVRTSDISNYEVSTDPTKSVSENVYNDFRRSQDLRANDILMVVDGRYRIGAMAILNGSTSKCVVQSHLRIISVRDQTRLDSYELLFALSLPSVRAKLRSLVFIQSTLGTLGARLMELSIPILHGDGPWSDRVDRFRNTLQTRAEMLSTLKTMTAPEVEL